MGATTISSTRMRPVRGSSTFDTLMWQFMRISGAALIPLALGHLAIMHVINNVHIMNACFVYYRWASVAWRVYDAGLLGFAMIHGLNGLRISVDDYVHAPGANTAIKWIIVIGGAALILAGAIALIGGVSAVTVPGENCTVP